MNNCGLVLIRSSTIALCNEQHLVTDVMCSSELPSRGLLVSNFHVLALELFTTPLLDNYSERLLG